VACTDSDGQIGSDQMNDAWDRRSDDHFSDRMAVSASRPVPESRSVLGLHGGRILVGTRRRLLETDAGSYLSKWHRTLETALCTKSDPLIVAA